MFPAIGFQRIWFPNCKTCYCLRNTFISMFEHLSQSFAEVNKTTLPKLSSNLIVPIIFHWAVNIWATINELWQTRQQKNVIYLSAKYVMCICIVENNRAVMHVIYVSNAHFCWEGGINISNTHVTGHITVKILWALWCLEGSDKGRI